MTQSPTSFALDQAIEISWKHPPKITITQDELKGTPRSAQVMIYTNQNGDILQIKLIQSTGLTELDQKLIIAIQSSQLKIDYLHPVNQPDQHQQFRVSQSFEFKVSSKRPWWKTLLFLP